MATNTKELGAYTLQNDEFRIDIETKQFIVNTINAYLWQCRKLSIILFYYSKKVYSATVVKRMDITQYWMQEYDND